MGYVELPDLPPPGGGRMSGTIVLERHELLETIDLLKQALAIEGMQGLPAPLPVPQPGVPQPLPRPVGVPAHHQPTVQQQFAPQQYQPQPQVGYPQPQVQPVQQQTAQPQVQPQPQVRPQAVPMPQPQVAQQQQRPPVIQQPQVQQQPVRVAASVPAQPQPRPVPATDNWGSATAAPAATAATDNWVSTTAVPAATAATDNWSSTAAVPAAPRAEAAAAGNWSSTTAIPAAPRATAAPPATAATGNWGSTTAAPAAATASPAASSRWQMVFTSDSDDHSNAAVTAMAYAQGLPGLPGGDGHAGWLVSASKGVLNLWETNRAASGEEMALMCMHSQAVDVAISKLVLEPSIKLCFGAALGTSNANECVSVHSLDTESLLASRYKFAPPANKAAQAPQRLMQQVESLHGMSPALKNHVIVSYGERLLLFKTKPEDVPLQERQNAQKYTRSGSVLHNPETHFVAHPGSIITAIHRSPLEGSCVMVTGAQDGRVFLWDMKTAPKTASSQMIRHTKSVTGLSLVSDDRLASSSLDGSVLLWDLRSTGSPLYKTTAPGGAAVLKIAAGPWGDVLAVSTAKGLHCLELFDFESPMTNIAAYPLQKSFTEIIFNTVTHDLYAGCANGSIQVFSRQA